MQYGRPTLFSGNKDTRARHIVVHVEQTLPTTIVGYTMVVVRMLVLGPIVMIMDRIMCMGMVFQRVNMREYMGEGAHRRRQTHTDGRNDGKQDADSPHEGGASSPVVSAPQKHRRLCRARAEKRQCLRLLCVTFAIIRIGRHDNGQHLDVPRDTWVASRKV